MPRFANAPEGMNDVMEKEYQRCRKKRMKKEICARKAIRLAKKSGYYKTTDGKWHKRG